MKQTFKLIDAARRGNALRAVAAAPEGHVVTIAEPTRTLDQNARLWAMLGDLSKQQAGGIKATPDDWKALVMHACGYECQFLQGLDGRPFPIGFRSSRLTVRQMAALIEWIYAYGAEQGVTWSEPNPYDRGAA